MPPYQGLETENLVRLEVDLRLIVQRELTPRDCVTQVHLHRAALLRPRIHLRLEEAKCRATIGLCPIEREIRVLEKLVGPGVRSGNNNSDARGGQRLMTVQIRGLADDIEQAPRECSHVIEILQIGDHDAELVAAQTRDGVCVAQARTQARRYDLEE